MSDSTVILSRFGPDGQWLASIIPSLDIQKLRIHSVIENVSQALKASYDLPKGIKATSMEWVVNPTNTNGSIKKRKRSLSNVTPTIKDISFDNLLLAIGTSIGSIVLFSPSKNSVLHILKSGHTVAVTSISQDITLNMPKQLYSCDITGQIVQWDLSKFSVVNKQKSAEQGTEIVRVIPYNDTTELLIASTASHLVEIDNPSTVIRTFSEFAHNINILDVSNIMSEFFVTASYDERNVIISSLSQEEPTNILVADSNIRSISIADNGQALAALSENGEVEIFFNPFTSSKPSKQKRRSSKSQKTSFADTLVRIVRPGNKKTEGPVRIKDVVFEKNYLVVFWFENGTIPVFEKIRWLEDNGEPIRVKLLEMTRARLSANIKPLGSNKHKGIDSAAVKGYTEATGIVTSGQDLNEVEEDDDEETLADRLEAIEVEEESEKPAINGKSLNNKKSNIFSTPGSFAVVLGQAIKTNDHKLLETCLTARDEEMIKISVQRLDSALAVKLLERLAEKMGRSPTRAGQLNIWIKWVMIVHGGYIVTVPNLVKSLSSLHSVLAERVSTLPRLLALQGRLEMLKSQIELRKEQKDQANRAFYESDQEEDEENVEYVEESEYIVNGEEDMYESESEAESEPESENGFIEIEAEEDDNEQEESDNEMGYSDVEDDEMMSEEESEAEPTVIPKISKSTKKKH